MAQQQHVDMHRKLALRRRLMQLAGIPLAGRTAYVPFIGDGDIAAELYVPARLAIYGADLDPARVANARLRLVDGDRFATVVVADCDQWPVELFPGHPITLADFDAYAYPYASFRAAWAAQEWAPTAVLSFTDGQRQAIKRRGVWNGPDGTQHNMPALTDRRVAHNMYWTRYLLPWFRGVAADRGYRVAHEMHYLRNAMTYWGAVIRR
jgi:hypothetical protein